MEYKKKDGATVPLRLVGRRYVDQILAQHPIPEPPTYEIVTVAGDKEIHTHDEVSARQTEGAWPVWVAYQQAKQAAIAARYEAASRFLLYSCVALDPPPLGEWSVDFVLWGLSPPDDKDGVAFKVFWIENELCPDPDDLAGLCAVLYALGGIIGEDQVRQFESFFRLTLARLTLGRAGGAPAGQPADSGPEGRD